MTSIVDPKYRVKKEPDFVAKLIADNATKFKTVTKKVKVEGSDETTETSEEKPDGVDVDKLFNLAKVNNIDVAKFDAQRDAHGFAGRFRMTLSNMLRAAAKQRHGLYDASGEFQAAPAEFLEAQKAPEAPTHDRDGTKFPPPPKPAKAEGEGEKAEATA